DPVTASAANSVNLFQPSATMTLVAAPTTAQHLGDVITYTYAVNNTSSADSPNLVLDTNNANNSFTDTLLGDLEADAIAAGGGSVAPGGSFSFIETRAIQAGDPSPLTNSATVIFTLAQNLGSFGNLITANAASLPAGASGTVVVSAVVPADLFGSTGAGNGDPLPPGLFELDGNAVNDPNVAGDDWSNAVFGNGGSSTAHSFVTDAVNSRT